MLAGLFFTFILIAMLDHVVRAGRIKLLVIKTQAKLLGLKGALQDAAISGTLDPDSSLFRWTNDLLLNAVEDMPVRHVWRTLAFALTSDIGQHDRDYETFLKVLDRPENARINAIVTGFRKCMHDFMSERHPIIVGFALKMITSHAKKAIEVIKERARAREFEIARARAGLRRHQSHDRPEIPQYC